MTNFYPFLSTALILIGTVVFLASLIKLRAQKFYEDTPWLTVLGIYVWGDAIVLGPFWLLVGIIGQAVASIWLIRLILVFFAARSFFEVIYWLNHQAHKKSFLPFLFQRQRLLKAHDTAILYQLINTCLFVVAVFLLLLSFFG